MNIWLTLYALLPAAIANMAPIVIDRLQLLRSLAVPLDGGYTLRSRRILGANKTVRGLLTGTFMGGITGSIMYLIYALPGLSINEHLAYGFLAGFGALVGDAVKSFFKRQIGIASGRPFIPFDQVDYVVGFLVATYYLVSWTPVQAVTLLVFAGVMNPLTNLTGYLLGIKKTYW